VSLEQEIYTSPVDEAECLERMADIEADIASIDDQVFMAKQRAHTHGEYADSDWFRRAKFALGMKRSTLRRLEADLYRFRRDRDIYRAFTLSAVDLFDDADLDDVIHDVIRIQPHLRTAANALRENCV
jgi:hypothetical protein